jgi:hypothetical protein
VCGSRTYTGRQPIFDMLMGMYENHSIGYLLTHMDHFTVIEGGAQGADALAEEWVRAVGPHPGDQRGVNDDICSVLHEQYPADWDKHGKAAGPIRNQQMLDEGHPEIVIAFVDKPLTSSRGTFDMVTRARDAGLPVYVVEKVQ